MGDQSVKRDGASPWKTMGTWVVNFTHIGNMLLVDWRECLCFRVICVLLRVVIKFFELGETKYTTLLNAL
jgi:hypothetical protein